MSDLLKRKYNRIAQKEADKLGIEKGTGHNDDRDAFRHAHSSAVLAYRYNSWVAKKLGDKVEERPDNIGPEQWMDLRNNEIGREIGQIVKERGGSEEELAAEVKKSFDSGEIVRSPLDPRRTYEEHGDWDRAVQESEGSFKKAKETEKQKHSGNPEKQSEIEDRFNKWDSKRKSEIEHQDKRRVKINTDSKIDSPDVGIGPAMDSASTIYTGLERRKPIIDSDSSELPKRPSILDGIGATVGKVGDAVAGVSQMAFDAISNIDADTLVHTITQAVDGGNGKAILADAARVAMGQALGRMHSLVMREGDMQTQQGGIMSECIMIPEPDASTKEAIEGTLNNPANAEVFDKVGSKIEAILQDANDVDPAKLLVSKVMEVLRGGGIKIEPSILIPDLFPQEDGEARKPQKGENVIEIAGIAIPIKIPEIRIEADGKIEERGAISIAEGEFDAVGGGISTPKITGLHRGTDGAIKVKGYVRGDGTQVRSHSRTAPDDILANNLSFRRKG